VTHPFHPWFGRVFRFVAVRQPWGEDRVLFLDEQERLLSLPVGWTDAAPPDVFVELSAGRCPFRIDDLISLAGLLEGIRRPPQAECKGDSAVTVR
jgi:hypothetical protein